MGMPVGVVLYVYKDADVEIDGAEPGFWYELSDSPAGWSMDHVPGRDLTPPGLRVKLKEGVYSLFSARSLAVHVVNGHVRIAAATGEDPWPDPPPPPPSRFAHHAPAGWQLHTRCALQPALGTLAAITKP